MNRIIILITCAMIFITTSCNSIKEDKKLKNIKESYAVFNEEQSAISKLMKEKPDSALKILNNYIEKYPVNINFLSLRASLYFQLEDYINCKKDIDNVILLQPDSENDWRRMLEYLDCKINKKDNNCDSLLTETNVYEIEIDSSLDAIIEN